MPFWLISPRPQDLDNSYSGHNTTAAIHAATECRMEESEGPHGSRRDFLVRCNMWVRGNTQLPSLKNGCA